MFFFQVRVELVHAVCSSIYAVLENNIQRAYGSESKTWPDNGKFVTNTMDCALLASSYEPRQVNLCLRAFRHYKF